MLVGIVGKPSAGKSTFFKSMTLAEVDIASYPFTTIHPNRGAGHVRVDCADKKFGVQCNPREGYCDESRRFVPVELMDVAGLVPGAHEGKGMGNKFLDDLRQASVLIHVVDASGSTDEQGRPVDAGTHDPVQDVKFLESELDNWYLGLLNKSWDKFSRKTYMERGNVEEAVARQFSGLNATVDIVKTIIKKTGADPENPMNWSGDLLRSFAVELRKTTKPILIAANKCDMEPSGKNIERLREQFKDSIVVPCSAESELALKEASREKLVRYVPGDSSFEILEEGSLSPQQKKALSFIQENVLEKFGSSGVQNALDRAVFEVLKLIYVFPGGVNKLSDSKGNVLPDCLLLRDGSTALDFAYKLHTDLGDGFIRAVDVKTKKTVGKDHVVSKGDVIEIISR